MDIGDVELLDPRARRSRAALFAAVVDLVSRRGTTNVSITEIAVAADLSRPVVYQQFGDRDSLLVEAALDLVRRELLPQICDGPAPGSAQDWTLCTATHFAKHRAFYKAILTGSCAYLFDRGLTELRLSVNRPLIGQAFNEVAVDQPAAGDLAIFVTGGGSALLNSWIIDGEDPLDPAQFTERMHRIQEVLMPLQ